ncbi:MAG TPA: secondary thiamine-phosphate synthase enzyme YjbQ [Candidatus Binataceae bacterium]|nr:secondary thiamine-phosphate synthase enzyme YjbQ [Candidatus Binataceae bacterium]
MREFKVKTSARVALVDITQTVHQVVASSGVANGLCNLFTPHTTAALIVSENWDPDVTLDLLQHLQQLVPREGDYRHSEGNSQAHILSVMLGVSLNLPIEDGKLALGRWQGVLLAEFDGPRERSVRVTIVREA